MHLFVILNFLSTVSMIDFTSIYKASISLLFFLAILTFTQHLAVTLPFQAEVTVDFAILLSIIIIFGSKISIFIVFLSTLITEFNRREIMPFYKSIFNINLYVIMVGLASLVYEKMGGQPGRMDLYQDLLPIIVMIFIYLFVNVSLVTVALSLLEKQRSYQIFSNNFKWALPNYIALAPLGMLLAVIYLNIGILGVFFFLIPLLTARHSFQLYINMRKVYLETIQALATTIEAKDPYTHGHSDRVAKYSSIIAKKMKLPVHFLNMLEYAALLHDIGKIGIPEQILNKPGKLSESEFDKVKQHPELGASIVEKLDFMSKSATFIKFHHERLKVAGILKV